LHQPFAKQNCRRQLKDRVKTLTRRRSVQSSVTNVMSLECDISTSEAANSARLISFGLLLPDHAQVGLPILLSVLSANECRTTAKCAHSTPMQQYNAVAPGSR